MKEQQLTASLIAKKDKRNALIKERVFVGALIAYPMLMFAIFYIGVNVNSILLAFQKIDQQLVRSFAGFSNFKTIFEMVGKSGSEYYTGVKNALLMVFVTMFTSVPVSLLFGYYLFKKARFAMVFRVVVMLPGIMSALISGLMVKSFILSMPDLLGLIGIKNVPDLLQDPYTFPTILIYMVWDGFSGGLIIIANAMGAIDSSILESGEIDGITLPKELIYIIIPLIWPTLSTFIVLAVSGLFGAMGPLYVFFELNAPSGAVTIGYLIYRITLKSGEVMYPQVAALGLICTAIVFPVTMLVKRGLERLDPNEN